MKKAIIIGATSGIGMGLARMLAANSYKVGITGRRQNLLLNLKNENPDQFIVKAFDVSDTLNVTKNLDSLTVEMGGLDLLIISSGYGDINADLDFRIEKQTIDVNVSGFTAVADWAFNYFALQKHGHLVAITSIAGLRGFRDAPAYSATKSYQIKYLEGLRQKACKHKYHIDVTDIRPGFVNTAMAKSDFMFWVAPVEEAVCQIFKAIKHKKTVAYITRRWTVIALLYKLIPRQLYQYA
ncbi:MAG TPA: SDR family NAD(P)-dependent oxidoreductase [Bacteroidales bacterium]